MRFKFLVRAWTKKGVYKNIVYKASSSLQLFDFLIKNRNWTRLRSLEIVEVAYRSNSRSSEYLTVFDSSVVAVECCPGSDPEKLESLAVLAWEKAAKKAGNDLWDLDTLSNQIVALRVKQRLQKGKKQS